MDEDTKHTGREGDESCDDGQELDDVFFPVTVVTKTIRHDGVNNSKQKGEFADEDAIMRCFNLSVDAHVQRISVSQYEPVRSGSSGCPDSKKSAEKHI